MFVVPSEVQYQDDCSRCILISDIWYLMFCYTEYAVPCLSCFENKNIKRKNCRQNFQEVKTKREITIGRSLYLSAWTTWPWAPSQPLLSAIHYRTVVLLLPSSHLPSSPSAFSQHAVSCQHKVLIAQTNRACCCLRVGVVRRFNLKKNMLRAASGCPLSSHIRVSS